MEVGGGKRRARRDAPKAQPHKITPPEPRDVVALIRAAEKLDPSFGAFLFVSAATGARRGEVCALRWTDVNWENEEVTIARSISMVPDTGGVLEKDTKTHAERPIALDLATMEVLRRRRAEQERVAEASRS